MRKNVSSRDLAVADPADVDAGEASTRETNTGEASTGEANAWEDSVGYSRAVRVGDTVWVAGTTATVGGEVTGVGDPYEQARIAFGIALTALRAAGLEVEDVVRTRMFVADIAHLAEIGRAHHELFDSIRPAATMVQVSGFAHRDHLVEIELDAHVASVGRRERLGS